MEDSGDIKQSICPHIESHREGSLFLPERLSDGVGKEAAQATRVLPTPKYLSRGVEWVDASMNWKGLSFI